jgi:hypothetical protein
VSANDANGVNGRSQTVAPLSLVERAQEQPAVDTLSDRVGKLEQIVHRQYHDIENLKSEQKRFTDALFSAGRYMLTNPMSKMMLSALPKDAQIRLKEWLQNGV